MKSKIANDKEKAILDAFWDKDSDYTTMEILEVLEREYPGEWNRLGVFRTVNGLLEKELLVVTGLEQNKTQYARKYRPSMTREEYAAFLLEYEGMDITSLDRIALAMFKRNKTSKKDRKKLLDNLQNIIDNLDD